MPRTANRQKYLNLALAQARHLSQHRELLVVLPCDPQPEHVFAKWGVPGDEGIVTGKMQPDGDFGQVMVENRILYPPLGQPGDVVLCREQIFYNPEHDNYYFESDRKGCGTMAYVKMSGFTSNPIPFSKVPEEAIHLRPTIERVECREVRSITVPEMQVAGFGECNGYYCDESVGHVDCGMPDHDPQRGFVADWSRRYRRRGERFGFEVAWGFFYWMKIEGENHGIYNPQL